jgi:hypothetical protein
VVPDDGIPTLDNAFAMRSEAERYLFTCYSYMPRDGSLPNDPAITGGDEFWSVIDPPSSYNYGDAMFKIARGFQNANSPIAGGYWTSLYQGLRVCNIFLDNIDKVPDLDLWEREQWIGEVIFLKAYYHFYLVRMYGPVPLLKENISINASPEAVKVPREPVDNCFAYISELLDKAIPLLPMTIVNPTNDLGRITKPIAAALKAKVLVTAASPLFNGNSDQATLANKDGTKLFNSDFDPAKWDSAVVACKKAIDICHQANISLYRYQPRATVNLSDTIKQELTIRNTFTERWNSEIIWANTQTSQSDLIITQERAGPPNLDKTRWPDNERLRAQLQPPLKIAEMYYTNHGVPITEDKNWQLIDLLALREGTDAEKYYIKKGYTTAQLNFDREPRFYASLGFDGGMWYGHRNYGNNPDEYFWIACRPGGAQASVGPYWGPFTGYYWKKHVHFENVQNGTNTYSVNVYPWPIMRLADLYLLYAEALNEVEGPNGTHSNEMFGYIDMIREKAGLAGVKYSWDTYTNNKKYGDQNGMRQIIHRERLIELSLEGQRFWDLRRWKEAPEAFDVPVESYSLTSREPEQYYQRKVIARQTFSIKDYFWPIQISVIENNPNLVQNIGW